MVRLLLRLRALHQVERLLWGRPLVYDRADPADHADRIRGLPDGPSHVDATGPLLDRLIREFEGVELRLQFRPSRNDERYRQDSTTFEKSSQKYVLTKCAPNSAAIRQARPRYRASRFSSSFPTAVTASTGMPTSSPSSTSFPRFTRESCSWAAPMKIDRATAEAFSRTASFIEVVTFSFER